MDAIRQWKAMPMCTIIRLLGCAKRRLNPQSTMPGGDATLDDDAAIVAMLEKKMKAQGK
jgi:hypothetical protein